MAGFYDIVINGAGIVGTALALSLSKKINSSRLKICLINNTKLNVKKFKFTETTNRVSALSESSKNFLNELGVWSSISANASCCVKYMHIVDQTNNNFLNLRSSEYDSCCYICDNDFVLNSLYNEINTSNIKLLELVEDTIIKETIFEDNGYLNIKLGNGNNIISPLLIGCDGHDSYVRKLSKIIFHNNYYNQTAIVATLKHDYKPLFAQQNFTKNGIIALLPLSNYTSSLVWSVDDKYFKKLNSLCDKDFVELLNSYLNNYTVTNESHSYSDDFIVDFYRMKKIDSIINSSRKNFTLKCGYAEKFAIPSIILAGDAAHNFHPLAGQGLNIGLGDASNLSQKLFKSVNSGLSLKWNFYYENYNHERLQRVTEMITAVNLINLLYNSNNSFLSSSRKLAMSMTSNISYIRELIMKFAS